MLVFLWRKAILGALRRSWGKRSFPWLVITAALWLLRRFDGSNRRRRQRQS